MSQSEKEPEDQEDKKCWSESRLEGDTETKSKTKGKNRTLQNDLQDSLLVVFSCETFFRHSFAREFKRPTTSTIIFRLIQVFLWPLLMAALKAAKSHLKILLMTKFSAQ